MPNTRAAYAELIARSREAALLGSCAGVLGWDERTGMPPAGAAHRADQLALLAKLGHGMATHPRIGELLTDLSDVSATDDPESAAADVRELRRSYDRATKLPARLVEELARVTSLAQQAWQDARARNDFPTFRPLLEQVLALKREEADAVGHGGERYDALIDEFEPGATTASVRQLFAGLVPPLVALLQRIEASPTQPNPDLLNGDYPADKQAWFCQTVAAVLGYDFHAGRLDTTTHPFCTGLGPGDVRILTRYNPHHFADGFFGTLHEAGHGLYEQNLPAARFGTPCGSACSFGVHESQSRLWENQVGRSRPFWEQFLPRLRQAFPACLRGVGSDDFLAAVNAVKRSFIRVEADEVTYNLHVALRFELEVALLAGDLPVSDLPAAWNARFETLFGMAPPDDARGCLQDVHWSFGGIGYFPTYTIGNLLAAQFADAARQAIPDMDGATRAGDFRPLLDWLRHNIHQHGQKYRPDVLCERVTGRPPSGEPLATYLETKYGRLYAL